MILWLLQAPVVTATLSIETKSTVELIDKAQMKWKRHRTCQRVQIIFQDVVWKVVFKDFFEARQLQAYKSWGNWPFVMKKIVVRR